MRYKVKVTEKHSAIVLVDAESAEEAKGKAVEEANCEFESVYDSEILDEEE